MDIILTFIRDNLTGINYYIYAFICLFFMFAIIGYLFKQKYAKVEIKLNTTKPKVDSDNNKVLNMQQSINNIPNNQQITNTNQVVNNQEITNNQIN